MSREISLSDRRYSETIDLHYYASTFSDKQKTAKLFEQQLVRSSLDESFFKIKKKPFALIDDTLLERYRELSCRNCFSVHDEPRTTNYYMNVLDIEQVSPFQNTINSGFKYLRWMVTINDRSVDVSRKIPKNEKLLRVVAEECRNNENDTDHRSYLNSFIAKVSRKFAYSLSFAILKFTGILFHLFSSLIIERLIVSSEEVKSIRRAQKKNLPIVYLLRDPSPIDWFTVLLTLLFVNVKIPVVLRYENEKSKLLRWILKKFGVIFIRPPLQEANQNDAKHRVGDEAWLLFIEELVRAKNHFIVDLHTPYGDPDMWLFSVISQCISQQVTEDILIIPAIVSRDRKNVEEFLPENGRGKYSLSKLIDLLRDKFVKVNFCRPVSLKDLIRVSHGKSRSVTEILPQEVRSLTPKIISHIKYDFSRTRPVMTTDLVAYLLLKKYRNGVRFDDLAKEVTEFVVEFMENRKRVGFSGSSQAVVQHAVKTLGPRLVNVENIKGEKFILPILELPAVLKLAHHAHETMMHFMMDAVLFTSISMIFPTEFESAFKATEDLKFSFNQILIQAERLRDILQFEYAFDKFCASFYDDVQVGLSNLSSKEFIKKVEILLTAEEEWGHRLARHLEESDDDYDDYSDEYYEGDRSPSPRRNIRDDSDVYVLNFSSEKSVFKETVFYRNALKPYLQAYATSAKHLSTLNSEPVPSQYFCKTLKDTMMLKLNDGQLNYPETLSSNVLRNSLKLFEKWKVINCYRVHNVEFISLSHEFSEADAIERIVKKVDILK